MSKEKQIGEMAKTLGIAFQLAGTTRFGEVAEVLVDAGYRKSSEVAEEIFAEIEHTARAAIILLKFEKNEKLRNIKTECYTDLIGYIAELKKKYTEGEHNEI